MDSTKVASRLQALDLEDSSSHSLLHAAHSRFHHSSNSAGNRLNSQQSFVHSCDTLPLSPAAASSSRWSDFGGGDADDYSTTNIAAKKFAALGLDGPVLSVSQQHLSSNAPDMPPYQQQPSNGNIANNHRGLFSASSANPRGSFDVAALADSIAWAHSNDKIERGQHHSQPRPIYLHSPRRSSADFSSTPTNAAVSGSSMYSNGTMYGTSNQGIKILDLVLASTPSGGDNGYLTNHDTLHEAANLAADTAVANEDNSSPDGVTDRGAPTGTVRNGNAADNQFHRLSTAEGNSSTSTQADGGDSQHRENSEGDGHLVFDPTGTEFDDTAVFVNNDEADASSAKQAAAASNADKSKQSSGSGPRRMSGTYGRRQRHYSRGSNAGLFAPGEDYGRNRSGYNGSGAVSRYYPMNTAATAGLMLPSTPTKYTTNIIPGAKNYSYLNNSAVGLAISPPNSSYFSQYQQHQQALMYGVTPPQNMPMLFPANYQRSMSVASDAANAAAAQQLGSTPTSMNSFFPQFNGVPMPATIMNGTAAANAAAVAAVAAAAAAEQQSQQISAALFTTNNNNTANAAAYGNPMLLATQQPAAHPNSASTALMYPPSAVAAAQASLTSFINGGAVAYDAATNTTFVVGSPQTHNAFQHMAPQHQPPPSFAFSQQPASAANLAAPGAYVLYDPSTGSYSHGGPTTTTTHSQQQQQFFISTDGSDRSAYAGEMPVQRNNVNNGFVGGGGVNGYPQFMSGLPQQQQQPQHHQQQYVANQPTGSRLPVLAGVPNMQRTPPHAPLPHQQQHVIMPGGAGVSASQPLQKPRSRLLEDFRNNLLPDMRLSAVRGHVNEFARDQHGSRFIQQQLDDASIEDLTMVFDEIEMALYDLSTDVFANYVVQKFFECCTHQQRIMLGRRITDDILRMSLHMYGCRVAQKALEVLDSPMREQLAHAFAPYVLELIRDQNGNHVVQKALETVASHDMQFVVHSCRNHLTDLSVHMYGCRVVQRMMENLNNEQLRVILEELVDHTESLVRNEFGNYVIQHILEHGQPETKNRVIAHLKGHLYEYCQDKYASNVMEKCISNATRAQRQLLLEEIIQGDRASGGTALLALLRDQFGNYVVQKMIDLAEPQQRKQLLHQIKPHISVLRKYHYGKHIIAKLEKYLGAQQVAAATASAQQHPGGNNNNMISPQSAAAAAAAGLIPPPPQMPPNGALRNASSFNRMNNNKSTPTNTQQPLFNSAGRAAGGEVTTSLYSGAKLQSRHAVLNMTQPGPNLLGSTNHHNHHHHRQKENVGVTMSNPDVGSSVNNAVAPLPAAYSQYGIKPNGSAVAYQQQQHNNVRH